MSDRSSDSANSAVAGFTLPDGLAMVAGAAVASVHLRDALPLVLNGWGWILASAAFGGVTITATGPFIAAFALWVEQPSRSLRLGEKLWLILGTPWGIFGVLRIMAPAEASQSEGWAYQTFLAAMIMASLAAAVIVWRRWLGFPANSLSIFTPNPDEEALPLSSDDQDPHNYNNNDNDNNAWTNRIGFVLAILWPLQFALAILIGGRS